MTYKQRYAIMASNKRKILSLFPTLTDESGIYVLIREEDGIKYGYVGQSLHCLSRLAEHLVGYQHIDLSIKKHGLYSVENPTGYFIMQFNCGREELDSMEQYYIRRYAQRGYQLRNHTTGSQGVGKKGIDQKPSRGYYDGKQQGQADIRKEAQRLLKYIDISPKGGKLSERMYQKFIALIYPESIDNSEEQAYNVRED